MVRPITLPAFLDINFGWDEQSSYDQYFMGIHIYKLSSSDS